MATRQDSRWVRSWMRQIAATAPCCIKGDWTLADLYSGAREWPVAVKAKISNRVCSPYAAIYRLLRRPIETTGCASRSLARCSGEIIGPIRRDKLPILVDREAFAAELGNDAPDLYEEEVCLLLGLPKMMANDGSSASCAQVGKGKAEFLIRREFVDITAKKWIPGHGRLAAGFFAAWLLRGSCRGRDQRGQTSRRGVRLRTTPGQPKRVQDGSVGCVRLHAG